MPSSDAKSPASVPAKTRSPNLNRHLVAVLTDVMSSVCENGTSILCRTERCSPSCAAHALYPFGLFEMSSAEKLFGPTYLDDSSEIVFSMYRSLSTIYLNVFPSRCAVMEVLCWYATAAGEEYGKSDAGFPAYTSCFNSLLSLIVKSPLFYVRHRPTI